MHDEDEPGCDDREDEVVTELEMEELRGSVPQEEEPEAPDPEVLERALAQPFELGALLRREVDDELAQRDGEWSAFTSGVFRTIDGAELEVTRMSVEDRAIAAMKAEVDAELAELAPLFDAGFRQGVEQKIWQSAKEQPTWGARIGGWLDSLRRTLFPDVGFRGLGLVAAAAAVILVVALGGVFDQPVAPPELTPPTNQVTIANLSYEGSVTVMQNEGVAVVWLADDGTSL